MQASRPATNTILYQIMNYYRVEQALGSLDSIGDIIYMYRCKLVVVVVVIEVDIRHKESCMTVYTWSVAFGSSTLSMRMPTTDTARVRIAINKAVEPL